MTLHKWVKGVSDVRSRTESAWWLTGLHTYARLQAYVVHACTGRHLCFKSQRKQKERKKEKEIEKENIVPAFVFPLLSVMHRTRLFPDNGELFIVSKSLSDFSCSVSSWVWVLVHCTVDCSTVSTERAQAVYCGNNTLPPQVKWSFKFFYSNSMIFPQDDS